MKRTVKKKKSAHILPWLLLMAAAVALGLYMPGFFTRILNSRTDNTREIVDLGSSMLSITSDSAKLEKRSDRLVFRQQPPLDEIRQRDKGIRRLYQCKLQRRYEAFQL